MTLIKQRKKWFLAVAVSGIVLFAVACADLTAVREWSKTSLEATRYNELVITYADTPERLKRYDTAGTWDDQIAVRKNQAEALSQILSLVSDYMAALSTLSADSTIDYDKDVDALNIAIGKLNAGVSTDTMGAVNSLVKTVLGAAAKAYQAKQVTNIVAQANDPLQAILRGELRKIVDQDFRRDLKIEKTLLDRYYDSHLQIGSPSSAAKTALEEWKELRLKQNAIRLKAVDAYLEVLDKIAEGHQKLYNNRNKLNAKNLIKDLYSLAVELRKQINILAES
ncbi:MAG: hypothetical protein JW786_08060 [Desulfobacterales bacterium]|nr:hypothetical protein [Desulfobacterales bacterium]